MWFSNLFLYSLKGSLTRSTMITFLRMYKQMKTYKPSVSWLVSINANQLKSAYCRLDSSHLENFFKHIFEMGINRKLDFS